MSKEHKNMSKEQTASMGSNITESIDALKFNTDMDSFKIQVYNIYADLGKYISEIESSIQDRVNVEVTSSDSDSEQEIVQPIVRRSITITPSLNKPVQEYFVLSQKGDICSYAPPRGPSKELFCCLPATHFTNSEDKNMYRCDKCKDKVGRGSKMLEQYMQRN